MVCVFLFARPNSPREQNAMAPIKVTIKASTGQRYEAELDTDDSVEAVKQKLAGLCDVPADQQRLIYSGHVLKDEQTLEHYSERLVGGGCRAWPEHGAGARKAALWWAEYGGGGGTQRATCVSSSRAL